MAQAIGLAAMIVVLGIFMPEVLRALETLLLTMLDRATAVIATVDPRGFPQVEPLR